MSIYNREILEIKKEIIMEVMNDLKSIRNFKLKAKYFNQFIITLKCVLVTILFVC